MHFNTVRVLLCCIQNYIITTLFEEMYFEKSENIFYKIGNI